MVLFLRWSKSVTFNRNTDVSTHFWLNEISVNTLGTFCGFYLDLKRDRKQHFRPKQKISGKDHWSSVWLQIITVFENSRLMSDPDFLAHSADTTCGFPVNCGWRCNTEPARMKQETRRGRRGSGNTNIPAEFCFANSYFFRTTNVGQVKQLACTC